MFGPKKQVSENSNVQPQYRSASPTNYDGLIKEKKKRRLREDRKKTLGLESPEPVNFQFNQTTTNKVRENLYEPEGSQSTSKEEGLKSFDRLK